MPANERKVVEIILKEVLKVEQRCEGYSEVLSEAIVDILTAERLHRVKGTNIQQQVSEKCNAVGEFLAKQRSLTQNRRRSIGSNEAHPS